MPIASVRYGVALTVLLSAIISGCGGGGGSDGGTPPAPPSLEIRTVGRAERGGTITFRVYRDGIAVPPESVTVSATPGSAVSFVNDTTVRLIGAGSVTLTATVRGLTGVNAQRAITVALPPTIVFEGLAESNRDIYRVSLDGGELLRLTTNAADDRIPTAAGGNIVFVSRRDGNAELYQMPLAGGAQTRLTITDADENEPALSTSGGALVYVRANATGLPKLVITNGTTATELTNAGNASSIEATPSWSPARDRIVYLSTQAGLGNLYLYNVLAGTAAPLLVGDAPNVEPSWSPDGNSIVFVSDRTGDTELHLITLPGNAVTRLTTRAGVDGQPAFLPDGRIVYLAIVNNVARLRWLDPATPNVTHDIPTGAVVPSHPAPAR